MGSGQGARVGEWVEVRPLKDIMATLDEQGALQDLPFMPEMTQYAGRRFRIVKSAHKTCDPTGFALRRMQDAVHLEPRCDGSAHGGCEARCLLFWKRAWLNPAEGPAVGEMTSLAEGDVDLAPLQVATRRASASGEVRYRCQATEIVTATRALPVSELRQYFEDVSTRNVPLVEFVLEMVGTYAKAIGKKMARLAGIDRSRFGIRTPVHATAGKSIKLHLQPGELVQVRSCEEILATLDKN